MIKTIGEINTEKDLKLNHAPCDPLQNKDRTYSK